MLSVIVALQSSQHGEFPKITIDSPEEDSESDEAKDQSASSMVHSTHSQQDQEIQQDESSRQEQFGDIFH